ncbi:MAG: VOC family protein [Gammaproteobacteria bacterium]|nr:VOC family protein [Gammaproteobacteria bacterium]MDH5803502.1 VOC family protein [Gammaproteobacteria bacterium]
MSVSALTKGVHHIGLTVFRLEDSAAFFTSILGWREVKRREDYPAIFVSDGSVMITLWHTKVEPFVVFDKNKNVGLHHLALTVASEENLMAVYARLMAHHVSIEFAPELLGQGPARHMMCYEPSGNRIEFIWPGTNG